MPTASANLSISIGGLSISGRPTLTGDGQIGHQVAVPAAKAGTLSTRTSDTAGTLTLGAAHGLVQGDVIDIYWTGGLAYGATVGMVNGTAVPFTGAAGDVLPAQTTAVAAGEQVVIDTDFDGDLVLAIAAASNYRGRVDIQDAVDASILAVEVGSADPWYWFEAAGGSANPLAGETVGRVIVSNGDPDNAATVQFAVLYDSAA